MDGLINRELRKLVEMTSRDRYFSPNSRVIIDYRDKHDARKIIIYMY